MRPICLCLCLALLLSACGTSPVVAEPTPTPEVTAQPVVQSATLTLPVTHGSMDPLMSQDKINRALVGLIWEGLFVLDEQFAPQNLLCTAQTCSEDGLTWTFTVDTGRTFSDGAPVTAQAVAQSLDIARGADSPYAARLAGIHSVTAQEETAQVVVTLKTPNGALPSLLTTPVVAPQTGLGTGPYVLQGDKLVTHTAWWDGVGEKPWAEEIGLRELPAADDLIYAFDTGDISLVMADLTSPSALGYGGDNYEIQDYNTTTMEFVGFNCKSGLCRDPQMRQGLSQAFDRETIAVGLYARHAQPTVLPIHPDHECYDHSLAQGKEHDPSALDAALTAAGYEKNEDGLYALHGKVLTLTMVVNTDNDFRATVAQYLADTLTRMGVTVTLEKLAWTDYLKALAGGRFDLYLGATAMTADFDPQALLAGQLNYGGYWSGETNTFLSAFQSATGTQRTQAASALYAQLLEEMPFAPLVFKQESLLSQWALLDGETPTQQNPFYNIVNWKFGG